MSASAWPAPKPPPDNGSVIRGNYWQILVTRPIAHPAGEDSSATRYSPGRSITIGGLLRPAKRLDESLAIKLGQPYRILLGIGLVAEIAPRLREFPEKIGSSGGIVRELLAILLFAALISGT